MRTADLSAAIGAGLPAFVHSREVCELANYKNRLRHWNWGLFPRPGAVNHGQVLLISAMSKHHEEAPHGRQTPQGFTPRNAARVRPVGTGRSGGGRPHRRGANGGPVPGGAGALVGTSQLRGLLEDTRRDA